MLGSGARNAALPRLCQAGAAGGVAASNPGLPTKRQAQSMADSSCAQGRSVVAERPSTSVQARSSTGLCARSQRGPRDYHLDRGYETIEQRLSAAGAGAGPYHSTGQHPMKPITVAIPKGRILKKLVPLLERADIPADCLLAEDRRLVRTSADGRVRYLLLKPDDVPTYVEYGAASLGVVGRDTLDERNYELYQPVDLQVGVCRMVVAALQGAATPPIPRVGTKYPRIARRHFANQGVQAEVIFIQGSVELAPVTGLADLIVDLVETGSTLRENGLEEREVLFPISSVLVANRSLFKLHYDHISPFVERLRQALAAPKTQGGS